MNVNLYLLIFYISILLIRSKVHKNRQKKVKMQIETTYFLYHISSYLSNHDVWSQSLDQTKRKKNLRVHSTQGGCGVVLQKWSRETERKTNRSGSPPLSCYYLISINSKRMLVKNAWQIQLKSWVWRTTHTNKKGILIPFSHCLLLGDFCAVKVYIF